MASVLNQSSKCTLLIKPRKFLELKNWLRLKEIHESKARSWTLKYRKRKQVKIKHPVEDFLFTYYSFPLSHLERWSPGPDVELEGIQSEQLFPEKFSSLGNQGYYLDSNKMRSKDRERTLWIMQLLESVESRPPLFKCFGLHEWAMVYKTQEIRHESTPLRLSPEKIQEVVESQTICCTHYDAYRFFTKDAKPLNSKELHQDKRNLNEQEACVHFTMDLYKWSYKLYPWLPSSMIYDAFELALKARTLDMRASPYDLSSIGYSPIRIETPEGRLEYTAMQKELMHEGRTVRRNLIQHCKKLLQGTSENLPEPAIN